MSTALDLATASQEIVDTLTAAGVRAVIDPRDINPPCVLIRPPSVSIRFAKGTWDAEWTAWAIVADTGRTQSLKSVSDLIEATQLALNFAAITARPDDAVIGDGSTLPIYVLTWTARIR